MRSAVIHHLLILILLTGVAEFASAQGTPGVSQASLARAARIGPELNLNDWPRDARVTERHDLSTAVLWNDQLIVHSARTEFASADCQDRGCPASTLSAIDLASGDVRQVGDWTPPADAGAPRQQRLIGNRLLVRYGRKPALLFVIDLDTGAWRQSPALDMIIDDVVIHGDQVVIAHVESVDRGGKRIPQYSVSRFALEDFTPLGTTVTIDRPVLTDERVYTLTVGFSNGAATTVIAAPVDAQGGRGQSFDGKWPNPEQACRQVRRRFMNQRYYLEMNYCGRVRGIDFQTQRMFEIPYAFDDLFEGPAYSLSRDFLVVQGRLKNANRGQSDSGHPLYLFDLAAGRWKGRLQVGPYAASVTSPHRNGLVLMAESMCVNEYGGADGPYTLRAPARLQRVQLLDDVEIGANGADIARSYWQSLAKSAPDALGRFAWASDALRDLHASQPLPASPEFRVSAEHEDESVGEFHIANSDRFRRHLQERGVSSRAAASAPFACEVIDLPVHSAQGSEQTGWLSLAVRPGRTGDPQVYGWIADVQGKDLRPAPLIYRRKTEPTLLTYASAPGGWHRITPGNERAAWVSVPEDGAVSAMFRNRGDVLAAADEILLQAPRRLHAGPDDGAGSHAGKTLSSRTAPG